MEEVGSGAGGNTPPTVDEVAEATFRERAVIRLQTEHGDLPLPVLERWQADLHDEDPRGRVMAATAVWTMMDVRDARKQRIQRQQID